MRPTTDAPATERTGTPTAAPRTTDSGLALATLDALPTPLVVVDAAGSIVQGNAAWQRLAPACAERAGATCTYFDICGPVLAPDQPGPDALLASLQGVIDGTRDSLAFTIVPATGHARLVVAHVTRIGPSHRGLAVIAHEDVTAQREAERSLRRTALRLRQAESLANTGSWTADLVHGTFDASAEAARLVGWEPGLYRAEAWTAVVHPDDRPLQARIWQAALDAGVIYDCRHRVIVDGDTRWLHARADIDRDADGHPLRAVGVIQDVTSSMRSQLALENERSWLRALLNSLPDPVWLKDGAGRYRACNEAFEGVVGYPEEHVKGRTDIEFRPPEEAERYRQQDVEVITARAQRRFEVGVPRDGVEIRCDAIKTPMFDEDGQVIGVLGIARDVTAQRAMTDAIQQSERQTRLALDAAKLGIWRRDLRQSGHVGYRLDDRARRLYDVDTETIDLQTMMKRVHPDDLARVRTEIAATRRPDGPGSHSMEHRVVHRDGSEHWLAIEIRVVFEGDGPSRAPAYSYGTTQDITQRKRADEALRQSELNFRRMAGTIAQVFWMGSPDGSAITYASPAFERIWGRPCAELYRSPDLYLTNILQDDRPLVERALSRLSRGQSFEVEHASATPTAPCA
ncbi:MAG: PAS domain S-box protein [Vicinamibacterales bacterium]